MAKISVPRRFLEGEKVEVKQREKGLRGAWFEAVIVGVLPGKRIVEYDELLTDDGSRKLRETIGVSALFDGGSLSTTSMKSAARTAKQTIRPRPKPLEYPRPLSWLKGMWVDCWYEDAWWEGILVDDVTSTDAMEGSHLILTPSTEVEVDFPAECEILKIPIKDMRLTQDFQDGGDWSLREADLSGYRSSRLGKRKAQMD
ncbi:hypothetical protein MPTK1_6g21030 [Marchantia polymorpha subsp. ruderalis]|nr:hypothetical protein MARPO_0091s0052 [Marchantia polymorpha]BBN15616.1 hypothetical protein Mp_6g21030 [Marchantia polymorpha subsp. ruderalis]PTQ33200.1 hypothetical protein MARPO_0091s0052 [Marchantia polymorpha]PTQ33201.1 hypothetical protein MARPO_0091s0052 [Marchantia polymorpha]BBN15617.1 hypothetical protein Mp_6g21030 [Marchantia polymorpha subsp. ruderalis]|eukprot:PTQ33199.1 hypothetical protein MARPO_0091s0052 [Marchantia polymorpha]